MDQLYKVELLSSPDLAPLYSLESEIINQSQGGAAHIRRFTKNWRWGVDMNTLKEIFVLLKNKWQLLFVEKIVGSTPLKIWI